MKIWQIGSGNDIDSLHQVEVDDPVAGPGEVVVKVIAAGLNYRDLMIIRHQYGGAKAPDRVPLSDGVGVVESLCEGVEGLAAGTRVITPHFVTWLEDVGYNYGIFAKDLGVTANGWLAEKIVLPAAAVVPLPDSVSDETAATMAVVGGTVWHAMVAFGGAEVGKLVLAQGTGGVSVFSLQLAKALGADFAITSSSEEKLARAREMGADFTVNYREREDWAAALLEATGGRGADVVVDTLGFPALGQTVAATAVNGRIGTLGALSGTPQDTASASQGEIIGKNITIKGIASGSRNMLGQALDVVASNDIEMIIDREFAFGDAPEAYRYLDSGAHMGKVMIRVG
ncbi:zinc-dependent alcohol dehydrogenase family protein [Altererythrobacter sp. MF3-039]|uniref:zinc-dependent alcohol dehydrogenase family protein n=1 Tax=Altererythrobacter sp. MF3-039 TaxID=3252901 RepID=UPI00390C9DF1